MEPAQAGMRAQRDREAGQERYLEAAREAHPGWDFHEVFGGWEAVPSGTPVFRAVDLDALVLKLREREDGR